MTTPRIKKSGIVTSLSILGVAAVAGCSAHSTNGAQHLNADDANNRIERNQGRIAANAPTLSAIKKTNRPSNISVQKGLFLGNTGYRASNGNPLPSRFETPDGVSISLAGSVEISEFSQAIEKITGIRVDYSDIGAMPSVGSLASSAPSAPSSGGGDDSTSTEPGASGASSSSGSSGNDDGAFAHPSDKTFRVQHQGKLSDLLDKVASQLNVDWVYEAGIIQFLGPQTVTYTLWSLPAELRSESTVGGGGSDDLFGGSKPATVSSTIQVNYWENFETGLEAIIPNGGAAFSVSKSSGTIVVTGPRNIQRRVQEFIEAENARLSRQVAVKIDVVAFTRTRTDEKATSITGILDKALGGYDLDFNLTTPINNVENGINLETGILSGPLTGSEGAFKALSSAGRTSVLSSTSVTASNNTPTPVNITNEKAYLAGSSTVSDGTTTTTELEVGIVRSGINTVVTPRIMSSGEVVLQYSMNVTELREITEFASPDGATSVQLPDMITRNFMQTVNIESGDSLVIASFDQQSTDKGSAGPFSPDFWGVGGNSKYDIEDTKVLIIMTPVVIEAQNKPLRR